MVAVDEHSGEDRGQPATEARSKPSWRAKYPGLTTPVNVLFPAKPSPNALPQEIAATNRAAWKARKLVARAMLTTLATYVLLVEPASLTALGSAAFFVVMVSVMLPPVMPVPIFIMISIMLVVGQCLGWAWAVAAMASATRARDQVVLADRLRIAQASAAGAVNPAAEFQQTIFRGDFLDWRSTAVYAAFFAVALFGLGLVRATNQKLTLVVIFSSIVLDVMCSYGPLFPFNRFTLATQFLIPTACYIAVALAANILIFPQTLNSSWTTDLVDKFLVNMLRRSKLYSELLSLDPPPTGASAWSAFGSKLEGNQEKVSSSLQGLLESINMMEIEISYGRMSAKDLASLVPTLKVAMARALALGSLWRTVERRYRRGEMPGSTPNDGDHPPIRYTPRMQRANARMTEAESHRKQTLGDLLPILESSSRSVREAADDALAGAMAWLTETNSRRWFGRKMAEEQVEARYVDQKERVEALSRALDEYRSFRRTEVVEPFAHLFDDAGQLRARSDSSPPFSPASLFAVLSATDDIVLWAASMLELLRAISGLENKRRRNKFWLPTGLRKIGKLWRKERKVGGMPNDGENPDEVTLVGDDDADSDHDEHARKKAEEGEEWVFARREHEKRDPEAKPPKNASQRFAIRVHIFSAWLHKPETIFAFKYSAVSMLLWVPQIVPNSAFFTYEYKGLWALIMFQTGCAVYAGDQILQTVQKLAGTGLGLLYGCVIWYIGAGSGDGNRIGLGAAFFVFMIPPMAWRILAPPSSMLVSMMTSVTTVLIVGYSWTNTHLFTIGNTGKGIDLAWKRALLVIIGVAAATIAMIFPSPQTTRSLVRRTHATCINEIGRLYSAIISGWISEEQDEDVPVASSEDAEKPDSEKHHRASAFSEAVEKAARSRILAVYLKLNGSRVNIVQSTFELSLRGDWPKKEYLQLLEAQLTLVQAMAQLERALLRLKPAWRKQLVRQTAFLHSELISDVVTTFYLISLALRAGSPLPQAMPGPLLDRLLYHDSRLRLVSGDNVDRKESSDDLHRQVSGARLGTFDVTLQVLKDEQFAMYASAAIALVNILSALDEVEDVVKILVGEVSFPGYEMLALHRHHDV